MKDFLTIGEMSDLFDLNVQTLYYYDSIKLFCPKFRDLKTGRRRYEFDQVYELATICYMRKLGYSLEEIAEQRATQHVEPTLLSLRQRSEELHRQWRELMSIDAAIQRKIGFIEKEMEGIKTDEIAIRSYDTRKYIAIGEEEMLYRQSSFYFFPTIAFYEGDRKYFGAYINPEEEKFAGEEGGPRIHEIPAGEYLCTYHMGPYETVPETIKRLRASHPELTLDDVTINFNILDQFVEHDSADYITHMQVRILK